MKKHVFAALLALLTLLGATACAVQLPGVEVFSPGLMQLAQKEAEGAALHAEAEIGVEKAMYARDLSVLRAMLAGTTFVYDANETGEALSILRGGETLGVYAPDQNEALDALSAQLEGTAVLERVPLASVAAWLESLKAGDALALGFAVAQPFVLERTMSDDGTRLTKINISGAIAQADGELWRVTGFMRQPAGRAPKDTFELTIAKDEKNTIELLYSALREHEVTRKNKEGTASVRVTLKAAGKIAGYGVSSRLSVTMKNRYALAQEALSERISITASLTHQDNTPGRRWQRLNSVDATAKHTIRLTTCETGTDPVELTDEITLDVTMDSNAILAASANVRMSAGGDVVLPQGAQAITPDTAKELAAGVFHQLEGDTLDTIQKGL